MARQVASLFGVLRMQDSEFRDSLKDARSGMMGLGDKLKDVGQTVSALGAKMTVATAPLALGLAVGVKESREFSSSMANVNAILGVSGSEAAALRAEILEYGMATRAGPQETAKAFYDIVSGVQDASTHMAILTAATRTSEAGQADLKATTSALISTMNAYKLGAEDAAFVSDVFTRTVGMGVLTMDELASALPQATGLAAQFNVGLDEVAGSMAYMTAQGFSASQSATFLRGMMTTLLNPTADLKKAINDLGFESGQALLETHGLVGAYQMLSDQHGGLTGLVTNQEALTGSLLLTQETAGAFLGDFKAGIEGATDAARGIQNEVAGWDLFTSSLEGVAIMVGDQLAPVLLGLLNDHILPLITAVVGWARENPELANTIVLVAGALVVLGPALAAVGFAVSGVGAALGLLLSPIGLVVAAVAGLALAWATDFGGIRTFVEEEIFPRLEGFFNWLGGVWTETIEPGLSGLYEWFTQSALPAVVGFIEETVIPAVQGFIGILAGIWEVVQPVLEALREGFNAVFGFIVENVITPFVGAIGGAIRAVGDLVAAIGNMGETWSNNAQMLGEIVGGGHSFGDILSATFGAVKAEFGFSSGTPWTGGGPTDEVAGVVHRREAVVPEGGMMVRPSPGGLMLEGGGGQHINYHFGAGAVVIRANSEAEGRAAARGFAEEMQLLMSEAG